MYGSETGHESSVQKEGNLSVASSRHHCHSRKRRYTRAKTIHYASFKMLSQPYNSISRRQMPR